MKFDRKPNWSVWSSWTYYTRWTFKFVNTENSGVQTCEKVSFGTQKLTLEVVSETKITSKYIPDHSWVIPTRFPYEKHIYMKIDLTSLKIENIVAKNKSNAPAWVLVEIWCSRYFQFCEILHCRCSIPDGCYTMHLKKCSPGNGWMVQCSWEWHFVLKNIYFANHSGPGISRFEPRFGLILFDVNRFLMFPIGNNDFIWKLSQDDSGMDQNIFKIDFGLENSS